MTRTSGDVLGLVVSWECQAEMDLKIVEGMWAALGQTWEAKERESYLAALRRRGDEYRADPERAWAVLRSPPWALGTWEEAPCGRA